MNDVKRETIEYLLQRVSIKPEKRWIKQTRLQLIDVIENNVTNSRDLRISFRVRLINLLSFFSMNATQKIVVGSVVVLTVLGGGGFLTARVANASVPGAALYGVDLALEGVGRMFRISAQSRADYELSLLSERQEELQSLYDNNAQDDDVEKGISEIDAQTERIRERIREMESEENEDALQFRNRLENQLEETMQVMEQRRDHYEEQGDTEEVQKMEQEMEKFRNENEELNSENEQEQEQNQNDDSDGQNQEQEQNQNQNQEDINYDLQDDESEEETSQFLKLQMQNQSGQ